MRIRGLKLIDGIMHYEYDIIQQTAREWSDVARAMLAAYLFIAVNCSCSKDITTDIVPSLYWSGTGMNLAEVHGGMCVQKLIYVPNNFSKIL